MFIQMFLYDVNRKTQTNFLAKPNMKQARVIMGGKEDILFS